MKGIVVMHDKFVQENVQNGTQKVMSWFNKVFPASLMLSSTGLAADDYGGFLGVYDRMTELSNCYPAYKQRTTGAGEESGQAFISFGEFGHWIIDENLSEPGILGDCKNHGLIVGFRWLSWINHINPFMRFDPIIRYTDRNVDWHCSAYCEDGYTKIDIEEVPVQLRTAVRSRLFHIASGE